MPCIANEPLFNDFSQVEIQFYATELQRKHDIANMISMRLDGYAADALIEKDFLSNSAQDEQPLHTRPNQVGAYWAEKRKKMK